MDEEILVNLTYLSIANDIRKELFYKLRSDKKLDFKYKDKKFLSKDVDVLMANIMFSRDADGHVVFPIIDSDNDYWKQVVAIKIKYMLKKAYQDESMDSYVIIVEKIFREQYKKFERYLKEYKKNNQDKIMKVSVVNEKDMTVLTLNVVPELHIIIPIAVYDKLKKWIVSDQLGNADKIIYLTMMRYDLILNSKNHQLGIDYDNNFDFEKSNGEHEKYTLNKFDVELFASPINRTLKEFCGAYPDIDKYYSGSLGSFFKYKLQSNKKYTMNPPYEEYLMTRAMKQIISDMEKVTNIEIFITIPDWSYNRTTGADNPYETYDIIKDNKHILLIHKDKRENYHYFDHLERKFKNVSDTIHIVLRV